MKPKRQFLTSLGTLPSQTASLRCMRLPRLLDGTKGDTDRILTMIVGLSK
ncbi:MAG: hypothetical protein NTU79_04185 [Planctomycetota bacterium]|nr:hypothetical protein [Planctomycetota bacterium]